MRRHTNPGNHVGVAQRVVGLTHGLRSLAEQVAAEEHKKLLEERRAKAERVDGRIGKRVRFSDEEVAEMRRLHEKEGKSAREIALRYDANQGWVSQVLSYSIRSRYVYP